MDVVTGAFSYTGSYIARRLLESGRGVRALSRVPDPEHALAPRLGRTYLSELARNFRPYAAV